MKVICDREKLRDGLAIANNVVAGKLTKPVLENLCLVATDDTLEIVGTDLETSQRYRLDDVQVEEPGPAVISARVALDFVRDLSGETVTLETRDGECSITSGADDCQLVTVDPDEFPVVSRFTDEATVSMQGGSFLRLVQQTVFAAAREPGRYAMHGVLVEIADDNLRMVGTDGRRLAHACTPIDGSQFQGSPSIIPTKGLQLFGRVIADPLDQIRLSISDNQIGMQTRNAEIFARLIEGEFPRYEAVISSDAGYVMEAERELLERKLRLVANVAGDEARAVKLKFSKDTLELQGQAVGRGAATAHMEVGFKEDEGTIAFNPDFVLDGLKCSQEAQIRLEFNDRASPGKFLLGESFVYIVMPITVDL